MADMKLRCPACGAEITLSEATRAGDLLALDKAAAAFGDDWPLIREYLDGFQGKREMKAAKRLRLAREVWQMWESGKFCVGGVWYRVGREEFREALRATCNQVGPGLTNHNYLKKVLVGAAEKTSQRRERELREREEGLRSTGYKPVPPDARQDDPAWRAELVRLGRKVRQARTPEAQAAAKAAYGAFLEKGNQ